MRCFNRTLSINDVTQLGGEGVPTFVMIGMKVLRPFLITFTECNNKNYWTISCSLLIANSMNYLAYFFFSFPFQSKLDEPNEACLIFVIVKARTIVN